MTMLEPQPSILNAVIKNLQCILSLIHFRFPTQCFAGIKIQILLKHHYHLPLVNLIAIEIGWVVIVWRIVMASNVTDFLKRVVLTIKLCLVSMT
jgi:hypothetical protein